MQVNSLVVCLESHPNYISRGVCKGNIYTVTSIFKNNPNSFYKPNHPLITLAEVPIEMNHNGTPMGFEIQDFAEIQPPTDVHIEEIISQPEPVSV